jgi:hypothetical protein
VSDRSAELEGRLVKSLEELDEQRASFDRVSARLGEDGFIAAWSREGADDQIDLKGSLERAYEQIVNDLHSMLELVEKEAHACGLVPDPQLARPGAAGAARQAWWKAAETLGIDVSQSDQIRAPGRWRRLALYGHLDHELATLLAAWSNTRDALQHVYAQRNAARGREVWASIQAFRLRLKETVDAVLALRDRCADAASDR